MNKQWITCKATFLNSDAEQLESLGIPVKNEYSLEDFIFDLNEVVAINRSDDGEKTTIWFMGTTITTDLNYDEFKQNFK